MTKLAALLIALACVGCSDQKSVDHPVIPKSLAGSYVAYTFIMGEANAADGSHGTTNRLTLTEKGTYVYVLQTNVMMKLSVKAEGNYVQSGSTVTLTGTQTTSMDDGYKKSNDSGVHSLTLTVENDSLDQEANTIDLVYFRKEGTGPPPLPAKLQLKQSEATATALIDKVEKDYAALKSVRITGTVKSHGGGFVAEDAQFKILFQSPTKFRFEAIKFDGGHKEFDRTEVTWGGGQTCWWYTKEFGETTERPLGNALGIVGVNFGPEANIQPSLLMPKELGGFDFKTIYPETSLLADETVDGKPCSVLNLRGKGGTATKLWIDKSTNLIVKYYEELRDVTVTFQSKPNDPITSAEFNFGKRSGAGKAGQ